MTRGKALVIVESPTKANTIRKYLGDGYLVEASVGHIRDLAERKGDLAEGDPRRDKSWVRYGVNIDDHFANLEEIYVVPPEKQKQVAALKKALKEVDRLYLATDDDREGEAISWHLAEVLQPKVQTERLVFHEITKDAIAAALSETRPLNLHLVEAQRTRRIVDRLYGWDVSEILWRKVKQGLSAGRVQSVALRMLVERERERIAFRSATWWDLTAHLLAASSQGLDAQVVSVAGRKIAAGKDFDDRGQAKTQGLLHLDEHAARALATRLASQSAVVRSVETQPQTRRPAPPFTTSTLQQESSRKLRMAARDTMQVAQRLYESGFITYMRTDSVTLSEQALQAARGQIADQYGERYLPAQPRRYQTKTANAQEAHEAIRPAGTRFVGTDEVRGALGDNAAKLYDLIWKRTVASQMVDAQLEQTTVEIELGDAVARCSGQVTRFAGFLQAYREDTDEPEREDREKSLPLLTVGETLRWGQPPLDAAGHTTQPPARLTDASLIKALEERGIGRPSTYAAILQNLLDKTYCFRRGQALVPSFTGMAVVRILQTHMAHLVDYNFTAAMEGRLDGIARGESGGGEYLRQFYEDGFADLDGATGPLPGLTQLLTQVRDRIEPIEASSVPIGETADGEPAVVRIGRYGTFVKIGERTANVPEDQAPDELTPARAVELIEAKARGEAPLGLAEDGTPVFVRTGRFGPYLQLGAATPGGDKPKMVSLSKGMEPGDVTLDKALAQLALPRTLGLDPTSKAEVVANVGRYGDFIKAGEQTRSLPPGKLAVDVTLDEALAMLRQPKGFGGKQLLREIATLADGKTLSLWTGRFGLYVTDGERNATLKATVNPDNLTPADVEVLLTQATEARLGKVLGPDPESGESVRVIDGRFGPYVTNGKVAASLARGTTKDDLDLAGALDRLQHFGKPIKAKPGKRGAKAPAKTPTKTTGKAAGKTAGKTKAAAAESGDTATAEVAAKKPAAKTAATKTTASKPAAKAKAPAAPKAPPPKPPEVASARSLQRAAPAAPAETGPITPVRGVIKRPART
jgi:DNA topoisomerase-1